MSGFKLVTVNGSVRTWLSIYRLLIPAKKGFICNNLVTLKQKGINVE
jgi:hypothetical protein